MLCYKEGVNLRSESALRTVLTDLEVIYALHLIERIKSINNQQAPFMRREKK